MTIKNTHADSLADGLSGIQAVQANIIAPGCLLNPDALHIAAELDDQAVVDDAVDGRSCRQGVLEDLAPFGEDEVGGDDDAAPLVPLGQEGEQNLHLLLALLDVAQIVEDDDLEAVEAPEFPLQLIVPLGAQQATDQLEGGGEENAEAVLDPLVAQRRSEMGFDAPIDMPPLGRMLSAT